MDWNITAQNTNASSFPGSFCRFSLFLEVLLPYVPPALRQPLLLFSKFFECMECLKCPKSRFSSIPSPNSNSSADQLSDIFSRVSPFLSEPEREKFSQMQSMMQMMQMYQMMQSMSSMFGQQGSEMQATDTSSDTEAAENTENAENSDHPKNATDPENNNHPENSDSTPVFSGFDPSALLSALSPEQQQMFEMMKGMMNGNN